MCCTSQSYKSFACVFPLPSTVALILNRQSFLWSKIPWLLLDSIERCFSWAYLKLFFCFTFSEKRRYSYEIGPSSGLQVSSLAYISTKYVFKAWKQSWCPLSQSQLIGKTFQAKFFLLPCFFHNLAGLSPTPRDKWHHCYNENSKQHRWIKAHLRACSHTWQNKFQIHSACQCHLVTVTYPKFWTLCKNQSVPTKLIMEHILWRLTTT